MKKALIAAVVIVIVVVAAAGVWFVSRVDQVVAGIIEREGSAATQTAVRVGDVSIDLRGARASLADLTIANPDGFGGTAFDLGNFSVEIDPASVATDTIVLEEVIVSGARLDIIQRGARNNMRELLANLEAAGGETSADGGQAKKLVIERFVLAGASASVSAPDLDEAREIDIPTIELDDIGRATGGATATQVAQQVLEPVIERALRSAAVESFRQEAQDKIDEVKNRLLDSLNDTLGNDDKEPPAEQ